VRIIGLDIGDKRIGVAISDHMGWTAQGLETIENTGKNAVHAKLQRIIDEYKPDKIIIGLPLNMNGSEGYRAELVKKFGEDIKTFYPGEIIYWDERLTTVSAHRAMIDGGVRRKKRKQKVDQIAAILILQNYLDYYNNLRKEG
jgi:putative Holliday junction resolvase